MEIYDKAHEGVDAYRMSFEEIIHKKLKLSDALTYGEVVFTSFVPLLGYAKPKAGEVFWDIGCGAGKPVIIASLAFPELKACKGVEILDNLVKLASKVSEETQSMCE